MVPAEKFRPKEQATSYPLPLTPFHLSETFLWTQAPKGLECPIMSPPGKATFNDLFLNIYTEVCLTCSDRTAYMCVGDSHICFFVNISRVSVGPHHLLPSILSSAVQFIFPFLNLCTKITRHALVHAWFCPLSMTALKLIPVPACKHCSGIPLCESPWFLLLMGKPSCFY